MSSPKVSICIPTYNYANYISETIESILSQNFTDFELVIVDDCSADHTAKIVESYANKDSRINFIANKVNLGMVKNWNYCLDLAQGEYIKFVFGDDLLASPDTISRMVSMFDSEGNISLVGSARNLINESSQITGVVSRFGTGIMNGTDVINYCLVSHSNYIGEPSVVMFKKSHALRGFSPVYKQLVDLEMWFHLLEQGLFAYINEPLCSFRVHEKQQSRTNESDLSDLFEIFSLQKDYIHKEYIFLSNVSKAYLTYDCLYIIWSFYKKGRISYTKAMEYINSKSSLNYFWSWFALYKIIKPLFKQYIKFYLKPRRSKITIRRV